jgi:peptide/nickel transport system ATP-binding protein
MREVQLEVRNIEKTYESGVFSKKPKSVLKNISLKVHGGQTLGIVGESGIGKTTLGKIIVGIEKPTAGEIYFHGKPLTKEIISGFRRKVQMLFQDPEGSLNPKKTIQKSMDEILDLIKMPQKNRKTALENIFTTVGLSTEVLRRRPSQISGGQNQRVALARILLLEPEIIILDEPTSALDISVQAQILHLLKELQKRKGLAYIFISHDRQVIQFMCSDIGTIQNGSLSFS